MGEGREEAVLGGQGLLAVASAEEATYALATRGRVDGAHAGHLEHGGEVMAMPISEVGIRDEETAHAGDAAPGAMGQVGLVAHQLTAHDHELNLI